MTYDLSLANIVPAASAFNVQVNAIARAVSSVTISDNKVQLTLSSTVKAGDVITLAYTKPATNPLQTSLGGQSASITGKSVTNNLVAATKDAAPVTITMTISPNHHIHNIINILLSYAGSLATQAASITPEVISISDLSGKLYLETLLVTGVTNVRIPLNLRSGVYNVILTAGGLQVAIQKMILY
jgi:hypothetical protein